MLGETTWRHLEPDIKQKTCSFPRHELVWKDFKSIWAPLKKQSAEEY